jgi:protocatechuate 3,4-dioxygenase beta subunit
MYRINFMLLALTLLFCIHLELSAQPQVKREKPGTATISGKVTFKGEPLRGVTVTLRLDRSINGDNSNVVLQARTDENGQYRLTEIPAGRHHISAFSPQFIMVSNAYLDTQTAKLNLAEGDNIENVDIELNRGGVITGRVTDSNHRPLVEERVKLMQLDQNGKPHHLLWYVLTPILTDDRGIYRFYGLPAGRYMVSIGVSPAEWMRETESEIYYFQQTFHPGVTDQSQAKVIEVGEGSEITGIDIVASAAEAKKTYVISGRVVSTETGQPVMGVELAYGPISDDGSVNSYSSTDARSNAEGEFRLHGILPGKYGIFTSSFSEHEFFSEMAQFEVTDNDVQGVEVRVRHGASLSGVIVVEGTNDPAVLAKISRLRFHLGILRSQLSTVPDNSALSVSPDGSFRVKGLQPGRIKIEMQRDSELASFLILRVEHDGVPQPDGIEVGPGEIISNLRIVLGYGSSTIRGEVKVVGATLPPNIIFGVTASHSTLPQSNRYTDTDVRGRFVFEGLFPGEYVFTVSPRYGRSRGTGDREIMNRIFLTTHKMTVGSGSQPPLSIVIDVNRREGN